MRILQVALACVAPTLCVAQRGSNGSVSGTVTCTDTNLPAHYATVALEPVREVPAPGEVPPPKSAKPETPAMISLTRTHLDGTFQVPNVKPAATTSSCRTPATCRPPRNSRRSRSTSPRRRCWRQSPK